jgi:hypothetical protein
VVLTRAMYHKSGSVKNGKEKSLHCLVVKESWTEIMAGENFCLFKQEGLPPTGLLLKLFKALQSRIMKRKRLQRKSY